ncbi:MAG TPA: YsnF/AvaK domain-containing protein [Candidatus Tectomicrobia bacterium]
MPSVNAVAVRGKDGWCGTVLPPPPSTGSDPTHVRVQLESGEVYLVPEAAVIPQPDGSVSVPLRIAELVPAPREAPPETLSTVVPVLAEELEVQKRRVETSTVRLTKVIHEREVEINAPLWREEVEVTRVPMQRVVEGPVPVREEDGTTIISRVEEVLVVEKRWMLREEIHIRQQRREIHQPQRITLRSEEVQVERVPHAEDDIDKEESYGKDTRRTL